MKCNKILFVNGKIGFGSPPCGKPYWKKSFVQGAKDFFPDSNHAHYVHCDFQYTENTAIRFKEGEQYALENYDELVLGMKKDLNAFQLVTHSMGSAFGEGIKNILLREGWDFDFVVHINAWHPTEIKIPNNNGCFVIDYQNTDDPLRYFMYSRGNISGADLTIKEPTGYAWYRFYTKHRSPIHKGRSFWKLLENSLPKNVSLHAN